VSGNVAGQNNSNLPPFAASVANGEWELILGLVPIIVFNTQQTSPFLIGNNTLPSLPLESKSLGGKLASSLK
jgi:hypothetical protein